MKRIAPAIILIGLVICSCRNRNDQIVIQGTIRDGNHELLHLALITPDGLSTLDSVRMKDGDFTFILSAKTKEDKARLSSPMIYQLFLAPANSLSTMAKGGDHIVIEAEANDLLNTCRISGAEEAELMWQLDSALRDFVAPVEKLYAVYQQHIEDDSIRADIESQYTGLLQNHIQYLNRFIQEHPCNMASYIAFYQSYNRRKFFDEYQDWELLKNITQSLKEIYPDSPYVKVMEQKVEIIEIQHQQKKRLMHNDTH